MPDIRILVVDDSVAVRRALGDAIEREPGLSVCGAAPNGLLGLELLARTRPDVVVLDLEMPVLDGLEFLSRMRPEYPKLPVLIFSGAAGHSNEATLEAMWRGGSDYVLKPSGLAAENMLPFLRAELFPRLRALAGAASPARASRAPARVVPALAPLPVAAVANGREPWPSVVVIGASTGGPRALAAVLGELPRDYPLPVVVVQHMPAEMTEFFAAGLAGNCELPVRVAQDGAVVASGSVWLAPGGTHLLLTSDGPRARFRLDHGAEENGCRPSVDPLFRSATRVYGSGVLAVVLTGMGQDGLEGARVVHAAQGRVLVQDEASSVVWGMPGAVARAGVAHAVMPLAELGPDILARSQRRGARDRAA